MFCVIRCGDEFCAEVMTRIHLQWQSACGTNERVTRGALQIGAGTGLDLQRLIIDHDASAIDDGGWPAFNVMPS